MKLGATPVQIGMALGWLAASLLVADAFYRGGIRGVAFTALFAWGTIAAGIEFQRLSNRCARYERALSQAGIDPTRVT